MNCLKKYAGFITFIVCISSAYADIPIHVMTSADNITFLDQKTIQNIQSITKQALAHDNINIGTNSPYQSVQVQLVQSPSQRYLLAHLMSRYFFTYKIMRINLNENNTIHYPIQNNYQLQSSDFLAEGNDVNSSTPICPSQYQTGKPLFVIGAPNYSPKQNDSIYHAVTKVSRAVLENTHYRLVSYLGQNATIQHYQNILACPTLKYFFHIGGEDKYGESFVLANGDFDASYFSQNPQLNFSNTAISFDTCRAFDQVKNGFCPLITAMPHPPLVYTAGSSQLLVFGTPETYACFWKKIINGAPISENLLQQCAQSFDPSVKNSHSGIYFVNFLFGHGISHTTEIVTTNKRTITIPPKSDEVVKLASDEAVENLSIENNGQTTACTPDPTNRIALIDNRGLNAAEFNLDYIGEGSTCQYTEISRTLRYGDISRDIYGFYPTQSCFHQPSKAYYGLTLKSNTGQVNLNCNGGSLPFMKTVAYNWQGIFNNNTNLSCTFNLASNQTEIASMHLNIGPSTHLPGELAGQISDLHSMNGHPLPTITYSGKNPAGYNYGVKIVIN